MAEASVHERNSWRERPRVSTPGQDPTDTGGWHCGCARLRSAAIGFNEAPDHPQEGLLRLSLGAIGIVFGDIGTSPLYTLKECFGEAHGLAITPENVLGLLSLVLWALILVVTVKYVLFIMRADNRGEGGVLALEALAEKAQGRRSWFVLGAGLFGAALFFGDGVITPAISVLSAVEGLSVAAPAFEPFVVPIAVAVLVGLFAFQKHGTDKVGSWFGPIMLVWFADPGGAGGDADRRPSRRSDGDRPALRHRLLRPQRLRRLHRAGRRGAGDHRRRGALRRHGPLRRPAGAAVLAGLRPAGAGAELHGPERAGARIRPRRRTTRSTCWRRSGRCCRWSASPPPPPSSPRRR